MKRSIETCGENETELRNAYQKYGVSRREALYGRRDRPILATQTSKAIDEEVLQELRGLMKHPLTVSFEIQSEPQTVTLHDRGYTACKSLHEFRDWLADWNSGGRSSHRPVLIYGDDTD